MLKKSLAVGLLVLATAKWAVAAPEALTPCWTGNYYTSSSYDGSVTTNSEKLTAGAPYSYTGHSGPGPNGEWSSQNQRGVCVFSLSSLQVPGQKVQSATLHYGAVSGFVTDWDHRTGDITAAPSLATFSKNYQTVGSPAIISGSLESRDVTSMLQADLNNGFGYSTFTFFNYWDNPSNIHMDVLMAPTPEPSSMMAVLAGLGGLGLAVRRKRS